MTYIFCAEFLGYIKIQVNGLNSPRTKFHVQPEKETAYGKAAHVFDTVK